MNTKRILGLDLGTNSIGWALIEQDFENKQGKIIGLGSRIIPMSQDILSDFGKGTTMSQTADRRFKRRVRRLYQRKNLRRERLHRVLNILGFLPSHYKNEIDFEFNKGQFLNYSEPKLPYFKNEDGKYQFLFTDSYNEMVKEFKQAQPKLFYLKSNGKETKIPYDWTIYFLRKKALTHKISKEELAWILLNFNQKRGYYQLSEEGKEQDDTKVEEYHALKVVDIKDSGEKKKTGETWYNVILENGWVYKRASKTPIDDWNGKIKEFIVTTEFNEDGSIKINKDGTEKRSFRIPKEDDWELLKNKTESEIQKSYKTVGAYIYETLLTNPTQKIRGKLVRTIERKFYKDELLKILKKQIELHPELQNKELYNKCINELYPNNEAHRKNIENKNFIYLFIDDIIFYQRPLKTKKHLISNCPLEYRIIKNTSEKVYLKCIAKSNPLFQEFRLWQFISNLKIYERERDGNFDIDVTNELLKNEEDWTKLFDWLNDKKTINQKQLMAYFKKKDKKYRWNYIEDKEYPCNETRSAFLTCLKKLNIDNAFLTYEVTQNLWHLIYSVTDPEERKKAIRKFAEKHNLNKEFEDLFSKFPSFKRDYGSFSEKAIKKLLPLMRRGKYWSWDNIDNSTKNRIKKLQTGEFDENIRNRVREKSIQLKKNEDFKGLPLWLALYIVYDKHSEASDTKKWETSKDIENYLKFEFKQYSLRNPIVEQIVTETLRLVNDIWKHYGKGTKNFFNEIHIEMGRYLKKNADQRKKLTEKIIYNEETNQRITELLRELKENSDGKLPVENVRPYSPIHKELLKIYEEGVLNSIIDLPEDILKISKSAKPTKAELQRYKLWLEQKYRSPYTGEVIPLGRLFTEDYQIEHIIPKSRYFDDSLNNKVICESAVNQLKGNMLGLEFIKNYQGKTLECGMGKRVKIFSEDEYRNFIKEQYAKNKTKSLNLLLEDIPEKMIARQMNDTSYISKFISTLLSNIVRADKDDDGINSKNLIQVNGKITSILKNDWGLNDVWNDIIAPRFKKLNELTKSNDFGDINPNTNKFLPKVSDNLLKGFSKKRIDHRHHALDALVVACITKDHINYITSINTNRENYSLISKLRKVELIEKDKMYPDGSVKRIKQKVALEYLKPWNTFTQDARTKLEKIVVSFKQNVRVINKTKNKYWKWVNENGKLKKKLVPQEKGENWAIRKSLHKEYIYGKVELPFVKLQKNKFATAIRTKVDSTFDEERINKITDTGIQKILLNYLKTKNNNPEIAFSPEGLEELNQNIKLYNNNKAHKPIIKVRVYEVGSRFQVGQNGNKKAKFVETDKGSNLFFAIYEGKNKKGEIVRQYNTIAFNEAVNAFKQGNKVVAPEIIYDKDNCQYKLLFTLSPNDLVYVPTQEERENHNLVDFSNLSIDQTNRIWRVNDFSGETIYFTPNRLAKAIREKEVDMKLDKKTGKIIGSFDLKTASIDGILIKEICWKLKVDRLGNIKKI